MCVCVRVRVRVRVCVAFGSGVQLSPPASDSPNAFLVIFFTPPSIFLFRRSLSCLWTIAI